MRIDRYLHCIRLVKSRSQAQELVEQGHVRLDRRPIAKPSEPVRVGSIIVFPLRGRTRVIEVLSLPDRRGPASQAFCAYREIVAPQIDCGAAPS